MVVEKASVLIKTMNESDIVNRCAFLTEIINLSSHISGVCCEVAEGAKECLEKEEQKEDYILKSGTCANVSDIPHDPGCRPVKMNDAQKRYLISLGPFQPQLSIFPKNPDLRKDPQNRFNSIWYSTSSIIRTSIIRTSIIRTP